MRVKMLRTIDAPAGDAFFTYQKGALINVSDADGTALIAAGDAEDAPDVPRGLAVVNATTDEDEREVLVDVGVSLSEGTANDGDPPHVRLEALEAGGKLIEGPAVGEFVPAPAQWRFAKTSSPGVARVLSQCTGYESGKTSASIAALPGDE